MATLQSLLPASFRGVSFLVPSGHAESGRHSIKHEYPDSNTRYVEDNGLKVPDYHVKAVVHGADALSRLRALQGALDTPGPGTLVHPIWGRQFVQVMGPYKVNHSDEKVGVFEIEITFAVTGPASFPGLVTGIAAAITNLSATSINSLFQSFAASIDLPSAAQSLSAIGGAISSIGGTMASAFGAVAGVQSIASQMISEPMSVLTSATGLAGDLQSLVRAPFDASQSLVSNVDLFAGFSDLHATSGQIIAQAASIQPITIDLASRASALSSIGSTMQAVSLVSMCEASAGIPYKTAEAVAADIATLSDHHATFMSLGVL